jgi:hypothetical protein
MFLYSKGCLICEERLQSSWDMLTGRLDRSSGVPLMRSSYRADYATEIKMVKSGAAAMEVCSPTRDDDICILSVCPVFAKMGGEPSPLCRRGTRITPCLRREGI